MPKHDRPDRQDLVLGGSIPPPIDSLVLGGIAGLRQRFAAATPDLKIQLLVQTINYDRAGVNLLIEALHDPDLTVRTSVYELLAEIDTNEAREAIALGIPINPGDRIYRVYESQVTYNDNWYYLEGSLEYSCYWDKSPQPIGSYLSKEKAESVAWEYHKQRASKLDLSDIGRDDDYYSREDFKIERWAIENFLLDRQPDESLADFAERLRKMFEAMGEPNLAEQLWHDFQTENFDLDRWIEERLGTNRDLASPDRELQISEIHHIISKLSGDTWIYRDEENYSDRERRVVRALESLGHDELLGRLWLEVAGKLAFVEEEIVTEAGYFNSSENP